MTAWSSRDSDERHRLARRFAVRAFVENATNWDREEVTAGIPFPRLYDSVLGAGALGAEVAAALLEDSDLRADFDLLLERTARYHLPRAAVASTGELDRRETGGLVINLVRSRANPAQVYVLIEVEGDRDETVLIVRTPVGEYLKESLPPPDGGTIRLLKSAEDPIIKALRDPASEVFLL